MAWLLRGDDVLATLEMADTFATRLRGLMSREALDGAFLIRPAMSVHTFGMRFPIDVAYCDGSMKVLQTVTMKPYRLGILRPRARCVIEAEAGAFSRWGLCVGDQLQIRT